MNLYLICIEMLHLNKGWRDTIFNEVFSGKGLTAMLQLPAKHEMFLTGAIARGTTTVTYPTPSGWHAPEQPGSRERCY